MNQFAFDSLHGGRMAVAGIVVCEFLRNRIVGAGRERVATSEPVPRICLENLVQFRPILLGFATSAWLGLNFNGLFHRIGTIAANGAPYVIVNSRPDQVHARLVIHKRGGKFLWVSQIRLPRGSHVTAGKHVGCALVGWPAYPLQNMRFRRRYIKLIPYWIVPRALLGT